MNSLMNMSKYLRSAAAVAFYCALGTVTVLGLAWADVAFAQSRLSVVRVVVQKATATPRLSFAHATVSVSVGDTLANPAASDQPDSKGAISYQSSDDSIVSVAADGHITAVAAGTATITATQAADLPAFDTGSGSYPVMVVGPLTASTTGGSRTWLVNEPLGAAIVPVSGSGGIGKLRYAIAPALPAGLDYSAETGAVSGSATVESALTVYTVTVTDSTGHSISAPFSLAIGPELRVTVNRAAWVAQAGDALDDTPVAATGGIGALTYTIAPSLPGGLTFDAGSGTITGRALAASARERYTVTASDSASPVHTVASSFTLVINGVLAATSSVPDRVVAVGDAVDYRPVTGAGGVGVLRYTVAPALPAGLSLDPATGAVSGTAVGVSPATDYTVTVTDADSPAHTGTAAFRLEIKDGLSVGAVSASHTVVAGDPVAITPVTVAGGVGTLRYAISPALPAGLALDTGNGAISGRATAESASTDYTVTVSDDASHTASATFSLAVLRGLATSVLNAGETHRVTDTVSYTPPTTWGGVQPYRYTVSPALPGGLAWNGGTGAITGTATTPSPYTSYTYTVTDSASPAHSVTGSFTLTIEPALTAASAVAAVSLATTDAVDVTPVTAAGGLGLHHFSVQPALPTGLAMDEVSGAIRSVAGASLAPSPTTEYTVTVVDSASPQQTATARFTLAINAGITLTFTDGTSRELLLNQPASLPLVTAAGGTGTLTYDVAPPLPDGLIMDPATGAISGTPVAEQLDAARTYVVTVTDSAAVPSQTRGQFNLVVYEPVVASTAVRAKVYMIGDVVRFTPVVGSGAAGRPLEYRMLGSGLPMGLSLDAVTGEISGHALEVSPNMPFYLTVNDVATPARPTSAFFDLEIVPALVMRLGATAFTGSGTDDVPADAFVQVSGGIGKISYTLASDRLLNQIVVSNGGAKTGRDALNLLITPRSRDSAEYTLVATDEAGHKATQKFTVSWP